MGIRRLHGRELRQQFRDWLDAYALVEGQPVRFESLSVRSMNFGQDWRTPNVAEISYSLQLPMAFFLAFLDEPEQLADLVADTQQFPDRTNPLDNALLTAKPADAAAAMTEPVLAQELAGFFAYEALLRWLGDGGPEIEPGYVLNSIDKIVVRSSGIVMEGKGRVSSANVAYQDT